METEPQITEEVKSRAVVLANERGIQLQDLDGMYRYSKYVVAGGFAPKGMEKPESVLVAIQTGLEIGLTPMQALQSIAIINGRPGVYGDAALGLVRGSGLMESYKQEVSGVGDERKATVIVKRKQEDPLSCSFSIADAKRANLWGKQGPWSQYPERMLIFRARGFALRDAFGDVLKGLRTTEELADQNEEQRIAAAKPIFSKKEEPANDKKSVAPFVAAEVVDVMPTSPIPDTQTELAPKQKYAEEPSEMMLEVLGFQKTYGWTSEQFMVWLKEEQILPSRSKIAFVDLSDNMLKLALDKIDKLNQKIGHQLEN